MNAERAIRTIPNGQSAELDPVTLKKVLIDGDLAGLSDQQLIDYNRAVCTALGLDWVTQPFAYIKLNGKLVLYARRECTDQLRKLHNVSVFITQRQIIEDVYVVTAEARLANGRIDSSTGAVSIAGLKGEFKANAMMKAETKAKRRVTLSICGMGMVDESETDSIPGAEVVNVEEPSESDTLTKQDAARLRHDILAAGADADWINAYLKSKGFKGMGEMTRHDGDVMYRTAMNHRASEVSMDGTGPAPREREEPLFSEEEMEGFRALP